jgi:hypothetical protein
MEKEHGGKRAGAGRPPKSNEEELQDLLKKGWSKKQRLEAIKKAAHRASLGDLEALKLLMAYTFGKPKEKHEHSGPDGGSIPVAITGTIDRFYGDGNES